MMDSVPLHISRSSVSSRINKTGSWRYVQPVTDEKTAPCSAACPAGQDIPRIEMLMSRGKHREALETILQENPFPAVCGHVCYHPCEKACNRAFFDEPVAVHLIERFVGLLAVREDLPAAIRTIPCNGRRIAVVGAGPAGLAAGYFLARLGYGCDIFEAAPSAGGLLTRGIPEYRLPGDVVEKEVQRIERLGVRLLTGKRISGSGFGALAKDYRALIVGCGLTQPLALGIPGEDLAVNGLDFLKAVREGSVRSAAGTAAVIGGGNTAIDVARTLVRLGGEAVILYRRRRADMPAFEDEIRMALEEGVRIEELSAPLALEADGSGILARVQRTAVRGVNGGSGRARVEPSKDVPQTLRFRRVFSAIGAGADAWAVPEQKPLEETIRLAHCTLTHGSPPVLHVGDTVNRSRSVVDAIASGKAAAMAVDICLSQGAGRVAEEMSRCSIGGGPALSMNAYVTGEVQRAGSRTVSYDDVGTDYFAHAVRSEPEHIPPAVRIESFTEDRGNFSADVARREAQRCFNCGTCNGCGNCELFCPDVAVTVRGVRTVDLDYCKGCGVCVEECPRSAMSLKEA